MPSRGSTLRAADDVTKLLVELHLTPGGRGRSLGVCLGNDVDNPVEQKLFGDGVIPFRTTITEEQLIRPLNAYSSCCVDPQGSHWTQQFHQFSYGRWADGALAFIIVCQGLCRSATIAQVFMLPNTQLDLGLRTGLLDRGKPERTVDRWLWGKEVHLQSAEEAPDSVHHLFVKAPLSWWSFMMREEACHVCEGRSSTAHYPWIVLLSHTASHPDWQASVMTISLQDGTQHTGTPTSI